MTNIYMITNTINNKVYIGQTRRDVHTRFMEHTRDSESGVYPDAIKYGRSAFVYSILRICDDRYASQWEHYYICKYNSTDPHIGYNKVAYKAYKWEKGKCNPSKTEYGKARIRKYNKEHSDTVYSGFVRYNNSRKFPVAMLDKNDNTVMTFDSLLSACRYFSVTKNYATKIKSFCDKYNKNGTRCRFLGYYWTALNKNVQTNSIDECRVEDELPFK